MVGNAWIVVGLGCGDEGKGTLVDALTRRTGAKLNVRFNGGPQAAHHVITPDGRLHCFSQIGSGSFSPRVETFLSRHCFVDPLALQLEIEALRAKGVSDCAARIRIDPDCPLLTPWHGFLNRIQERQRDSGAHGSCGRGMGVLFADLVASPDDIPKARHLQQPRRLRSLVYALRDRLLDQARAICDGCPQDGMIRRWLDDMRTPQMPDFVLERFGQLLARDGPRLGDCGWLKHGMEKGIIFEGAQGALLDMEQGHWPHVTPSRTSSHNASSLLDELGFTGQRVKFGVVRAYATRHGRGPFVSENPGLERLLPEAHNKNDGWQGAMRVGWFDAVATRRAIAINDGIDRLAVTCLDRLERISRPAICDAYHSDLQHWGALEVWVRRNHLGEITGIDKIPPQDQGLREQLTRQLAACRPCVRFLEQGTKEFLRLVEQAIGKRIDCLSTGPSAVDKQWQSDCFSSLRDRRSLLDQSEAEAE